MGVTVRNDMNTGMNPVLIHIRASIIKDTTGAALTMSIMGLTMVLAVSQAAEIPPRIMPLTAPRINPAAVLSRELPVIL